jgi:hypothetical protein
VRQILIAVYRVQRVVGQEERKTVVRQSGRRTGGRKAGSQGAREPGSQGAREEPGIKDYGRTTPGWGIGDLEPAVRTC